MVKSNQIAAVEKTAGGAMDIGGRMDAAKAALKAAETPEEARRIEIAARALREAAAAQQDIAEARRLELEGSEIAVRAMRRYGELLPPPDPGVPKARRGGLPRPGEANHIGDKNYDSRRRAIAGIPAADFEAALAEARAASRPATQTALLEVAKRLAPMPAADPDAQQKKLTRQRARAMVDGVAAIDACEAELLRIVDLLGNQLCDPLIEAVRAVDAARAALLRDERCAPALKKGPTPPADSPLVAWDRRQAELAEADGDQAAIEAGDDFDPSVDPTPIGEFPAICPDCNGDSPLPGRPACARCESTGQLLDGKPYPSGDA